MQVNKYTKSLMTRRSIVQIVYKNNYEKQSNIEDIYNDTEYLMILDKEMFDSIVLLIIEKWDSFYDEFKVYLRHEEDWFTASLCAQSVLRSAYYEIISDKANAQLIICDYLQVSKMFCYKEKNIINRILDKFYKSMLD